MFTCRGWVVTFISQQKSSGPNHVTKSSGSKKKMLRHAIFSVFFITALELIRKLDGCPSKMSEKMPWNPVEMLK